MTYITRIANKRILAKYFLYRLQINYLHWKLSASRSIFSFYATIAKGRENLTYPEEAEESRAGYSAEQVNLVISGLGLLAEPDLLQFLHEGKHDQQSHILSGL